MARECHKCQRPNNDRAKRCIYCGAEFAPLEAPAAPAAAATAATEAPAAAPEKTEVYLAVVSPRQDLSLEARQALGVELAIDPFTVSQKLLSPAPWTARTFVEPEPAQHFTRRLLEIGLDAYLLKQSGVDTVSRFVAAAGLTELREDGVTFIDAKRQPLPVAAKDLFLIVRGRIQEKTERQDDPSEDAAPVKMGRMALGSLEPRQDLGGIRAAIDNFKWSPRAGLMRLTFPGQAVEIMDLYVRGSNHPVRVTESEFDYRGLGERMSPSGLLNFNLILNTLTAAAPDCPVDVSFNAVGYTMRETPKQDRVRERLGAELGVSESMKRIVDNRAFFSNFSARLFLHYLRQSRKK